MWIFFAIGASIFWGITYVMNEQVYRHISVLSSLAITLLVSGVLFTAAAFASGTLEKDISTIVSSQKVAFLVGIGILFFAIAELCIGYSIMGKNATIAGLIEISYPLFIALFSYFIFKETQLGIATAIGGAFILVGIITIYTGSR